MLIEYDGTEFHGWARQPGFRTVQDELERALEVVRREPTKLTVAGRTDAGVHALGQVASHHGAPASARSLNALLPDDVAVLESAVAPDGFDARRDALSRSYVYRVWPHNQRTALLRERVLAWHYPIDRELLDICAASVIGEHDFEAFTLSKEPYISYRRVIDRAEWLERDGLLEFWVRADSFTRRMVRSLVGFQLDVARGAGSVEEFVALLDGAPRSAGGRAAAAHGLYLAGVEYPKPVINGSTSG